MVRRRRFAVVLVAVATSLIGTVGCDPAPVRPVLTVNSTANGPDVTPGDGRCKTAVDTCTLQAAFDEGNALPRADLVVPDGTYQSLSLSVTGDLRVNWGTPHGVRLGGVSLTVQDGARLAVDGVMAQETVDLLSAHSFSVVAKGNLQFRHGSLFGSGGAALSVGPGGQVVLDGALVVSDATAAVNAGTVAANATTFWSTQSNPVLTTTGAGSTILGASAVVRGDPFVIDPTGTCSGTPPTSQGYVRIEAGCGSVPAVGDSNGPSGSTWSFTHPIISLAPTSPLVDAIPIGTAGCAATGRDAYGNPRAVDGNGDGTAACDIGGVERQP